MAGRKPAALLLCLVASGAGAAEAPMLSEADHAAWHAIGRLNTTGDFRRQMCTATLIAPDRVLTAAHCVVSSTGMPVDPASLRFVAGWLRGDYVAVGLVASVTGAEAFAAATQAGQIDMSHDSAVLTLTAPIPDVTPLPLGAPLATAPARILGYRWDRPHALSDAGPCQLERDRIGVLAMDCPATFGNSGGPVLQQTPDGWQVVGVVSAIGQGRTYGAPLPDGLN